MRYFRVDTVHFEAGDKVPLSGKFVELHDDSKEVERLFEAGRPESKPGRQGNVFVFKDERDALSYCTKDRARRLYEVEVADADVLHEADMHLIDQVEILMGEEDVDRDHLLQLVDEYWRGVEAEVPTIELIVSKATVIREIEVG